LCQGNDRAADQCIPQSHFAKQLPELLEKFAKTVVLLNSHVSSKITGTEVFIVILQVLLFNGLMEEVDVPHCNKLDINECHDKVYIGY
jgi:hypothetical protein